MKPVLKIAASLPDYFPVQVRYPLAALAVELDRQDAMVAARAVYELARLLELDFDFLASLDNAEQEKIAPRYVGRGKYRHKVIGDELVSDPEPSDEEA